MKKTICFILAAIFSLSVWSGVAADQQTPLIGDVNFDNHVNTTDARLTLQHAVNKIVLDDTQMHVADVNGDGAVNTTDARLILQYAVGKIHDFIPDGIQETPAVLLGKYIIANGERLSDSNRYCIVDVINIGSARSHVIIWYDSDTHMLEFQGLFESGNTEVTTYMPLDLTINLQTVQFMIETDETSSAGTSQFIGSGTINSSTYGHPGYAISNMVFPSAPSMIQESLASTFQSTFKVMITQAGNFIRNTGTGVTLYDLGFSVFEKGADVDIPATDPYLILRHYLEKYGMWSEKDNAYVATIKEEADSGSTFYTQILYETSSQTLTFKEAYFPSNGTSYDIVTMVLSKDDTQTVRYSSSTVIGEIIGVGYIDKSACRFNDCGMYNISIANAPSGILEDIRDVFKSLTDIMLYDVNEMIKDMNLSISIVDLGFTQY